MPSPAKSTACSIQQHMKHHAALENVSMDHVKKVAEGFKKLGIVKKIAAQIHKDNEPKSEPKKGKK